MGGEYKAWLYVENKVQELLGPVQYKAAHDFPPRSPQPRGKQDGTGTGDRTTPFHPSNSAHVSLSRCACVCTSGGGSGGGGKAVVRTLPR